MGAVCDVGVIASIFDDDGLGPGTTEITTLYIEHHASLPAFPWQLHVDAGL
jgi:hypothetical protein